MQMALLAVVLVAGAPETAADESTLPMAQEYVVADGSDSLGVATGCVGHPPCFRARPLPPPRLSVPLCGFELVRHQYYYRPKYNVTHQFDFPWRRPPYRHPGRSRCR